MDLMQDMIILHGEEESIERMKNCLENRPIFALWLVLLALASSIAFQVSDFLEIFFYFMNGGLTLSSPPPY